jgi:NADH-quinone oxidoreductase subunit F
MANSVKAGLVLKNRDDLHAAWKNYGAAAAGNLQKILVCSGTGCVSAGSAAIYDEFLRVLKEKKLNCAVELTAEPENTGSASVSVKKSGCHGFCEKGPLVLIKPEDCIYTKVGIPDVAEIVEKTVSGGEIIERLLYHDGAGKAFAGGKDIPFYNLQTRNVLEHCGQIDATQLSEYLAVGGYKALEKVLFDIDADAIIAEISDSNLRGRGGAGFPTGKKWAQVRKNKADRKYIVCNGDEGDPGAFMDQSVMEGLPHQMIEGMLIAARAVGASEGYIYVRAEYPLAVSRLRLAIEQAAAAGLLGDNILGTDFSFHLKINRGAGAFVCGEGSALTSSIEGKRGMPRVKLFRTVEKGLFGKPTVLNNVETFANVPLIINKGAAWYKAIGPAGSPGTKTFALTGNIQNTGLIEVPMGISLRKVIFDIGGGVRPHADGTPAEFKAVQIGGPSGGCLTSAHLDLPLDFDSLSKAGAIIGSGGLVVMDDKTCMVEIARFFMHFTQDESCGKCIPCREGTKRMLEILERIVSGDGKEGDIETLLELADTISHTALCGLGKTAAFPVISTIKNFRSEYEAHIREHICPAGSCQKLKKLVIDSEKCIGCTKCVRNCPVGAISGKPKTPHTIDTDKCIKCMSCIDGCPVGAIS